LIPYFLVIIPAAECTFSAVLGSEASEYIPLRNTPKSKADPKLCQGYPALAFVTFGPLVALSFAHNVSCHAQDWQSGHLVRYSQSQVYCCLPNRQTRNRVPSGVWFDRGFPAARRDQLQHPARSAALRRGPERSGGQSHRRYFPTVSTAQKSLFPTTQPQLAGRRPGSNPSPGKTPRERRVSPMP
jgi:hypothetical protein